MKRRARPPRGPRSSRSCRGRGIDSVWRRPPHRRSSPKLRANPLGKRLPRHQSPLRKPRARATFFAPWSPTRAGGMQHEGHRRTRSAVEVARPRPSRGRAPQHHPHSRQRADQGGSVEARLQGDRSRSRGHGGDRGRGGPPAGLDHRARAHVLRDRAQAPRRRPDRDRSLRRPRGAGDPRRPFPLHPADPARERLPRSRRRRDDPHLQACPPPTSSG